MKIEISTTQGCVTIKIFDEQPGKAAGQAGPCLDIRSPGQAAMEKPQLCMATNTKPPGPSAVNNDLVGRMDPARLQRMLQLLDEHPEAKVLEYARLIADEFKIGGYTARTHVRNLMKKKLVEAEDHGHYKILRLSEPGRQLLGVLSSSGKQAAQYPSPDHHQPGTPAPATVEPPARSPDPIPRPSGAPHVKDPHLEEIIIRKCVQPRTRSDFVVQIASRTSKDPMEVDRAISGLMERGLIQSYNSSKIVAAGQ